MSAACNLGKPDVRISIVSRNELRVQDVCKGTWAQKYVTVEGGSPDTHFTMSELKDLGAMLHDAPEFKTIKDASQAQLIINLGLVLIRDEGELTRADLVRAMLDLMKSWYSVCERDSNCIFPPTLDQLNDPNQKKIEAQILNMRRALLASHVAALPTGFVNLSSNQQSLMDSTVADYNRRTL